MRVTTKMLTTNYQRNINKNLSKFQKLENQLSTGNAVTKPSDNPFLATRIMDYKTEMARKEQYERNINDVAEFMDMTDTTLGQITDQMHRINELAVKASTGTNSDLDLKVIATEMDELMNTMVDTLNTSFENKYIFGGTVSDQKPFELVDGKITYHGNNETTKVEIANGVYVDRNIPGGDILGGVKVEGADEVANLFDSINKISEALKNNDMEQLETYMPHIEEHTDNILQLRGKVGAISSRMELSLSKNKEEVLGLTELLSNAADVDYAEKFIEYTSLKVAYNASLQISSQIIQPSILDFLK